MPGAYRASQIELAKAGSLDRCSSDHQDWSGIRFGSETFASQPALAPQKTEKPAGFLGIFLELGDRPWLDSRCLE
jgi:hypothetical protein